MSAVMSDKTPVQRFMVFVAGLAAARPDHPSWTAYERLKKDFSRQCPDASPQEYEQAMRAIAQATGV